MRAAELKEMLLESELPKALRKHLVRCIDDRCEHKWHAEFRRVGARLVSEVLEQMDLCVEATGLSRDEILKATDFEPRDLGADRLDSAFAEIRSVNFLVEQGFSKPIRMLRASTGGKEADILGLYGDTRFALDVVCASRLKQRSVDGLVDYIQSRSVAKELQVNATSDKHAAAHRGLIVVVNSEPAIHLGSHSEYLGVLRDVHRMSGKPDDYHLVLITGRTTYVVDVQGARFEGPDDCVFPSWPEQRMVESG